LKKKYCLLFLIVFLIPNMLSAKQFKVSQVLPDNKIRIDGGTRNNILVGAGGSVKRPNNKGGFPRYAKFLVFQSEEDFCIANLLENREEIKVGDLIEFSIPPLGTIKIETDPPSAKVRIGDGPEEVSRESRRPQGTYTIQVYAEGYESKSIPVTIGSGEYKKLETIVLKQKIKIGTLKVITNPPGAMVFIDGDEAGPTPLNIEGYALNKYEINIELDGYKPFKENIAIDKEGDNIYEYTLERIITQTGKLEIITQPPGAKVFIDDKEHKTPTPITIKEIPYSEYTLRLEKDHYEKWTDKITISEPFQTMPIDLKQNEFKLSIDIKTPGASVLLDDKPLTSLSEGIYLKNIMCHLKKKLQSLIKMSLCRLN
jgi:hypothetical protein